MKHLGGFLLGLALVVSVLPFQAAALAPDEIVSSSAVLMDAKTGQILFDKNMNTKAFPASTTKIMTGLLVIENTLPSDVVTVQESAINIDEWDSANIALSVGEMLPVDSALYALILPSANDAANALAEHVADSQAAFAQLMNQRAAQIGAVNTQFSNAHGLHADDHYTTAYDMALITREASRHPALMTYLGTGTHTISGTNLQPIERPFTNYQYMTVKESQFYDPSVLGGKVGYTKEAQHTMSTVAEKYGRTLICVVMGSPNRYDKFDDTEKLLDYGFTQFRSVTLTGDSFVDKTVPIEGGGEVSFHSETEFTALLRNDLLTSDIQVSYNLPETFQPNDRIPTSVEVVIPVDDATLPVLLGVQPLVTDIAIPDNIAAVPLLLESASEGKGAVARFFDSPPSYIALAVCSVLALVTLMLAVRLYTLRKRRQQRMYRLQQRMKYARPEPQDGPGNRIA